MDVLIPIFFFVIVAVVVGFALTYSAQRSQQLDTTFMRLAHTLQGNAVRGGWLGRPSVRFRHRGAPVLIDYYSTGGKHPTYYTQFHIAWPDRHFRLSLKPERLTGKFGKLFGMQDIQIGDGRFDGRYLIQGSNADQVRAFLAPHVCSWIDRLRYFRGNDEVAVSITAGTLRVKKLGKIIGYDELEEFTKLCIGLFDVTVQPDQGGIEFVDGGDRSLDVDIICQVCGEAVSEPTVYCRDCKTPHHEDCWTYYGACSTYGCGQRRFLVRRKRKV